MRKGHHIGGMDDEIGNENELQDEKTVTGPSRIVMLLIDVVMVKLSRIGGPARNAGRLSRMSADGMPSRLSRMV